jgi:hypothetical protein
MSEQIKEINTRKPNQVGHPLWIHIVVGDYRKSCTPKNYRK